MLDKVFDIREPKAMILLYESINNLATFIIQEEKA